MRKTGSSPGELNWSICVATTCGLSRANFGTFSICQTRHRPHAHQPLRPGPKVSVLSHSPALSAVRGQPPDPISSGDRQYKRSSDTGPRTRKAVWSQRLNNSELTSSDPGELSRMLVPAGPWMLGIPDDKGILAPKVVHRAPNGQFRATMVVRLQDGRSAN